MGDCHPPNKKWVDPIYIGSTLPERGDRRGEKRGEGGREMVFSVR